MTSETEDLILEYLTVIRSEIAAVNHKVEELKADMGDRLKTVDENLDKIEKRVTTQYVPQPRLAHYYR